MYSSRPSYVVSAFPSQINYSVAVFPTLSYRSQIDEMSVRTPSNHFASFFDSLGHYHSQSTPHVFDYSSTTRDSITKNSTTNLTSQDSFSHVQTQPNLIDHPTSFLSHTRRPARFVDEAEEIKEITLEIWDALMHKPFPDDIIIHLVDIDELKEILPNYSPGILGFALNGHATHSVSHIYVRKGELDIVLETLGHELGHVITPPLDDIRDEEAKAYAFEAAWVGIIRRNNIAGLAQQFSVMPTPAHNGIHDVGADLVLRTFEEESDAMKIYFRIAKKELRISK